MTLWRKLLPSIYGVLRSAGVNKQFWIGLFSGVAAIVMTSARPRYLIPTAFILGLIAVLGWQYG
jgi:hypothetical protein